MSERTQHVIDAIDGALADDEFPDAMRWSPEPDTVDDAPAPFDGTLVWQPRQRYELPGADGVFRATWAEPLSAEELGQVHRSLLERSRTTWGSGERRELDVATAVHVAAAGTPPPAVGEWTDVGHLVDDGLTFGFDGALDDGLDVVVGLQQRRSGPGVVFTLQPWQGAVLVASLGAAVREAAEAFSRMFDTSREEVARLLAALGEALTPPAGEEPHEEEPRARALRLRQQRNTGPSRDVVHQRRPRRLP